MSVYYRRDRDTWCIEVRDAFGRRSRKFLKSEAAARNLEAQLKASIRGQAAILARHEIPRLLLTEACELFIASSKRSFGLQEFFEGFDLGADFFESCGGSPRFLVVVVDVGRGECLFLASVFGAELLEQVFEEWDYAW